MSKAKTVIKMMTEASAREITGPGDVKAGDQVMFKKGTPYEGMVGFIVQIRPDSGKVDLKFGKATRMDVPLSDLLKVENTHSIAKG